jgi:hypothetical protein
VDVDLLRLEPGSRRRIGLVDRLELTRTQFRTEC